MPQKESEYPHDWTAIAEKDWQRAHMLLDAGDPELAGFCLQQAVEKFLKAFLLSHGWKLRRIHNLEALLDDATAYDASLRPFEHACRRITDFYLVDRYPLFAHAEVTAEDVQGALNDVTGLVEAIRRALSAE